MDTPITTETNAVQETTTEIQDIKTGEKTEHNPEQTPKEEQKVDADKPYKIKVNGKEKSVSLDELISYAQRAEGSEKKFKEAHAMRTQAEKIINLIKTDPISVLSHPSVGHDFKKLAEDYLYKQIQIEQLTPEQRELMDLKQKLTDAEQEKKTLKEQQDQERLDTLTKHYNDQYDKEITEALKTANLPRTNHTVKRVAYYLMEGLKRGVELKAPDIMDFVRKDYETEISNILGASDAETIAKIIGDQNLEKIRQYHVNKIKNPTNQKVNTNKEFTAPVKSSEKMDSLSWRDHIEKQFA